MSNFDDQPPMNILGSFYLFNVLNCDTRFHCVSPHCLHSLTYFQDGTVEEPGLLTLSAPFLYSVSGLQYFFYITFKKENLLTEITYISDYVCNMFSYIVA